MVRFSKIILVITIVLLLCWQLPWCYNFFFVKAEKAPFVLYSSVIGDFAMTGQEDGKGLVMSDLSGRVYTQSEFDSILPMFYTRQLMADGRFPDSINGVAVTPREAQIENFVFRSAPMEVNAPRIGLYPLLESMSGRVDLEMPEDVFRITPDGIEFITIASNCVNDGKSRLFTEAMKKKDFRFPALAVSGNPTTRKEYDEGYLLLDSERKLYHLKMVKERPYVRAIELPEGVQMEHIFITEFKSRKTLALLTDADNYFYVLNNKTYEVVKTGIPSFNPKKEALTILGNMFDWTVRVTSGQSDNYYAIDAHDYSQIKTIENKAQRKYMPGLTFTSGTDKYVKPRFF